MSVEIDHAAWEKWHYLDSRAMSFRFFDDGLRYRIPKGRVVFHLIHTYWTTRHDADPNKLFRFQSYWRCFEIIADEETLQLAKLLMTTWDRSLDESLFKDNEEGNWHIYFDEIDLDDFTASELKKLVAKLPQPQDSPLISDVLSYATVWEYYNLTFNIGETSEKCASWGTDHLMRDYYETWEEVEITYELAEAIIATCDSLVGDKYQKQQTLYNLVEALTTFYTRKKHYKIPNKHFPPIPNVIQSSADATLASYKPRNLVNYPNPEYLSKAISEWGTVKDFKRFLPVILEQFLWHPDDNQFDLIIEKLMLAEWQQWSSDERVILEDFLDTLWDYSLSFYPTRALLPHRTIEIFLRHHIETDMYLAHWGALIEKTDIAALRHLAAFVRQMLDPYSYHPYMLIEIPDHIWAWARQSSFQANLQKAAKLYTNRPYAHEFSETAEVFK